MEIVKPKLLYHASQNRNIGILEPRAITRRHENEGPVVFAGAQKPFEFLITWDDSWVNAMTLDGVRILVISDQERYQKADKGGTIYHLNSDTFNFETEYGENEGEWTSKVPVIPIAKEDYESGLKAQLDNGIQVYFVDKNTFDEISNSTDHGRVIMRSLQSENMKMNLTVKKFK